MNTFRNLTVALLTTIVIGLVPAGPSSASEPSATPDNEIVQTSKALIEPPAQLELINATEAQADTVADALAQFEDADLPLPPLQIEFYETADGCHGNSGRYHQASAELGERVDKIMICSNQMSVLLHELAHAWGRYELTDEVKVAFTEHWGLENWKDRNDAHLDRGVERAAETIAFTLRAPDLKHTDGIVRYVCAYEVLTGKTTAVHATITC